MIRPGLWMVRWAVYRSTPFVASLLLARQLGPIRAVAIVCACYAVGGLLGAMLLRSAPLGRVTWRNSLAAALLPWGSLFGGGSLTKLVTTSSICVALLAVAGSLGVLGSWLAGAWVLAGIAIAYLLKPRLAFGQPFTRSGPLIPLIAVVLVLALCGLIVALLGYPGIGALVSGGPLAAVAAVYGAFVGIVVLFPPKRWN